MTLPQPDPAFRWSIEPWGAALRCVPLEAVAQHLFTTRQLELRLVPAAGSEPRTADGWARAARSVGADVAQIMRIKQVHGREVRVLRRGELPGDAATARPEADAQVSNDPDVVLAVQVADCVPVLMTDPHRGVAAAVHAGWRGTAAGVAAATVAAAVRAFGCDPADLLAAIGPAIGVCCYQVGDELIDAFIASGTAPHHVERWFQRDAAGRLRLDLWSANRDQLVEAGVRADRVFTARLCTQTHSSILDSYRVEGVNAGRMAGLIRVPPATL